MMIEKTIRDYLSARLDCPVRLEEPETPPERYVVLEKTGSGKQNQICRAIIAIQSYGKSLHEAASLNEAVKRLMDDATTLDAVSRSALNSDYNFTDPTTKRYRYQAVYDITHY